MMKKLTIAMALLVSLQVTAQPGALDADFDANGIVEINTGSAWGIAHEVVQAPDGKLLVCGYSSQVGNDMFVTRLNPDGSNDISFGTNGMVFIDLGDEQAYCMALQPDGKILLAGEAGQFGGAFGVIRLTDSGSLDPTFGNNGLTLVEMGPGSESIWKIELLPDGRIIAGGGVADGSNFDFALIRLLPDGSLDNTFSFDGKVVTTIADVDLFQSMAVGSDGKITAVGIAEEGASDREALLVRYNSDGSLDVTFGLNGIVQKDLGPGDDELFDIVLDGSGKILVCGTSGSGNAANMLFAKFNDDGTIDNTFSFDGMVLTDFDNGWDVARSMLKQPDSRILIAGISDANGGTFAMARFNPDGSLDNTFGTNGKVTTLIGNGCFIYSVALQSDLDILACGYSSDGTYNAVVARYLSGMNIGIGEVDAYIGSTLVYPNPITDKTVTVEYELKSTEHVSIVLYDFSGKHISSLQTKRSEVAGSYRKTLGLPQMTTGSYLLKLNTDRGSVSIVIQIME